jgi:plasmid stabilization system protein ParE
MGNEKFDVVFKEVADRQILEILKYIAFKGYPETAVNFAGQLYDFGNSLAVKPSKYQICRKPSLAKRELRCAVFKGNYIFIYKIVGNEVIIYSIIHSKRYVF